MSDSSNSPAAATASPVKPLSALQILLRIPTKSLLASLHELSLQIGDDEKLEQRTGGSLLVAVFDPVADTCSEITISFGKPPPENLSGTTMHVGKKFHGLRKRHIAGGQEICSGQCAETSNKDTDLNLYPGCVAFTFPDGTRVYIGISGWKAKVDEVGAYYAGRRLRLPLPPNYRDVIDDGTLQALELGELVFRTNFDDDVAAPLLDGFLPPLDAEYAGWLNDRMIEHTSAVMSQG